MSSIPPSSIILKDAHLKDTRPRRAVLDALKRQKKPITPYALQRWLKNHEDDLNIATIYRVLDSFKDAHIIHLHPCDGAVFLCSLPNHAGHHGFLHCTSCNRIEEYADDRLCAIEDSIARHAKFQPHAHLSEVMGVCAACRS